MVALFLLVLTGCQEYESDCANLGKNLDELDTFGTGRIGGPKNIVVGGVLINVSKSINYYIGFQRTLTFKGNERETIMYLFYRNDSESFPYELNKFYKFDLNEVRLSGAHSGQFMDPELNKLQEINCA